MNIKLNVRRTLAAIACAGFLAGSATTIAPAAASAAVSGGCGSRTIQIPEKSGKALSVPVSRIRVEGGATCAEAYKVVRGALTKNLPKGWTVGAGSFKVPSGLTAQIAVDGKKKVEYATVGG